MYLKFSLIKDTIREANTVFFNLIHKAFCKTSLHNQVMIKDMSLLVTTIWYHGNYS